MCCSHGQLFVCVLTAHINQHYSTVLCGIKSCDCLLLQLHDPNDVIKTTKVKVAAFRTAICSNHKINCTLKFSINTGRGVGVWVQKRHSKQGPMASKQLVASQVTPPPVLPHPHPLLSYQANWRQALWDWHTKEPTVEWHFRLNGWTGEREMVYSISTPTHLLV